MRIARGLRANQENDFEIYSNDSLKSAFVSVAGVVKIGAFVISLIALVAAGIGIMNIMLVSVTERTKEIGIRKAVGARRKDILTQFLIEAVMVTAIGGAFGVLTGFGTAWLIALAIGFPLLFSIWSAVLGVGVSSIVGVISGLWPAWRAARLDPIEALRAE